MCWNISFFFLLSFSFAKFSYRMEHPCEHCKRLKKKCALTKKEAKSRRKREREGSAEKETGGKGKGKRKMRRTEKEYEVEWAEMMEWQEDLDEWIKEMRLEMKFGEKTVITAIADMMRKMEEMQEEMTEMKKEMEDYFKDDSGTEGDGENDVDGDGDADMRE